MPPKNAPSDLKQKVETEPTSKRTYFYAVLIALAFLLGLGTGYLFWGIDEGSEQPQIAEASPQMLTAQAPRPLEQTNAEGDMPTPNSAQPTGTPRVHRYDVTTSNNPALGPENAPITIIEFSDYECPYCKQFNTEVLPRLMEEYGDKIRFVYRDFPLANIHKNAVQAAEAANCAGEQGAYWAYNEKLFSGEFTLGEDAYQKYAEQLGLDTNRFDKCLSSGEQEDEVMADFSYAFQLGVRVTPTFFLNGIPIVGPQPFDIFKQIIDKELAGELP